MSAHESIIERIANTIVLYSFGNIKLTKEEIEELEIKLIIFQSMK